MKFIEYFFCIKKSDDISSFSEEEYNFWSQDDKGIYYCFKCYEKFCNIDISVFMQRMCGFDFNFNDEFYVDWNKLQPLFNIEITDDSEMPERKPLVSNQLVIIRGFCKGECSQSIIPYMGYSMQLLPSCEPIMKITRGGETLPNDVTIIIEGLQKPSTVKIGSIVKTHKNAEYTDLLFDTAYWTKYCSQLDVVIFNFDYAPTVHGGEPDFTQAYCAVHIKGNQIKVITNVQKIKKLYDAYSSCPAVDSFVGECTYYNR